MRLRSFTATNLRTCAALLPPGSDTNDELRARLPDIWIDLARAYRLNGTVTEDTAMPVAAFGMSVFLEASFLDACLNTTEPGIASQVYRAVLQGRSPVLRVADIARANGGEGLDLLVLHYWQHDLDLSRPRAQALLAAGHAAFRLAHEGFRIRRVFQEASTPEQAGFLRAGGFLEKRHYRASGEPGGPSDGWLMGLSRTDPQSRSIGTTVSFLFRDAEPRFGFSLTEQRLLHGCLLEGTDATSAVDRSPNTVKKLWQSIYARVEAVNPEVLRPGGVRGDHDSQTRGPEKRRHLLDYLRFHLEELRPHAPPPARRRRGVTSAGSQTT
jgi:hypothetical protein